MSDVIGAREGAWPTGDACDVFANCRNRLARCHECTVPEGARGPTQYVPIDKRVKHPATVAYEAARQAEKRNRRASPRAEQNRRNRIDGRRAERAVAREVGGERTPASGALGGSASGDVRGAVLFPDGWRIEVKKRERSPLWGWLAQGDRPADVLAIRAPEIANRPTLYVMDRMHLLALLGAATEGVEGT